MNAQDKLLAYEVEKDRQEALEHRDVLLAIAAILKQREGQQLFSYLFKNFEVMTLPTPGMQGNDLQELLGFLRAGNSIYKLACEADSEMAASLLAKLERDRYADQYQQFRLANGLDNASTNDNT